MSLVSSQPENKIVRNKLGLRWAKLMLEVKAEFEFGVEVEILVEV